MLRIGIDVGGTNTDAVLMDGNSIVAAAKRLTTPDVMSGTTDALAAVRPDNAAIVSAVMIGTTHFTNAVVQRRDLSRVAVLRLCGPTPRWP